MHPYTRDIIKEHARFISDYPRLRIILSFSARGIIFFYAHAPFPVFTKACARIGKNTAYTGNIRIMKTHAYTVLFLRTHTLLF